jgi:long-chain acyl-CoA synthetase
MTNLALNLIRSAAARPDHVAIRLDDATLTYAGLDALTQRVAGLLAEHGVKPGDRIALMLPNVPHFAVLYYGALRHGAVVVPMNPLLKEREVAYYLSDSGARVIFVWDDFAEEAELGAKHAGTAVVRVDAGSLAALADHEALPTVAERDEDDTAVILYTSGTTGQPKGAELTHANLGTNIDLTAETLLRADADDVIFGGLPLFHVFGQTCGLNVAIRTGATLTLVARFDAGKALEVLARDRVTVFEGVPTMFTALVNHPERATYDVSSLRVCVTGGASMPVEVLNAFQKSFGCLVLEGYGLSETSPVACFNHPEGVRKAGSIGTPVRGVELRLVDEAGQVLPDGEVGEICIRGHNVMKGYWNKPDATAAAIRDGWFSTGDLARRDEDGCYFIVDRKKVGVMGSRAQSL